jgi:hypothetical protein
MEIFMRIDVTTASFASAAQPRFLSPSPQKIVNLLDDVIPFSCGIRDFIERGQVFELFSKDIDVEFNISPEKITKIDKSEMTVSSFNYDCVTLKMDMPKGAQIKGEIPSSLTVYKNRDTGYYETGKRDGDRFIMSGVPLSQSEMGLEVMEWSRLFAADNKCTQIPFLNTFSSKPLPYPSGSASHLVKSAVDGLKGLIQRAFC